MSQSPQRSNPFDRELYMDEHHFEPNLVEAFASSDEQPGQVADWQLGLSPPRDQAGVIENSMGLSRMEELQLAIDSCKEMILSAPEHSDKRHKLVAKLVQLRLQVQELKDGPVEVSEADKSICGHQFMLQERSGNNPYFCGYRSHAKCMNLVTRQCAGQRFRQRPFYVLKICPETGLAQQKYRCAECRAKIAFGQSREMEPRLCDYTGMFYCPVCHWNDLMVIPARVMHNWDFNTYKVSRSSKQLLEYMQRKPLLKVEKLNGALFNYIEELRLIRKMRSDILLMKCYFVCCKEARNLRILWHLKRHQYFVEGTELYSVQDLVELKEGRLQNEMRTIIKIFIQHIKVDCEVCSGKGFLCELCKDKEIIFPFDDYVSACTQCCALFHRRCYDKAGRLCPRCQRRQERQESMKSSLSPDSSPERPMPQKVPFHAPDTSIESSVSQLPQRSSQQPEPKTTVTLEDVLEMPYPKPTVTQKTKAPLNPFEDENEDYDDSLNPFAQ